MLTKALIDTAKENPEAGEFYIEGHRLMAEILYFSQSGTMGDDVRFRTVLSHLDIILENQPNDRFALQFKRHINDLSGSLLQIRRFQHDTGTTLANLTIHLQKIRTQCPKDSDLYPVIIRAAEEVRTLRYGLDLGKRARC